MKRLCFVLLALVFLSPSLRAEHPASVSIPIGFARIRVPANERVLAAIPFHSIDEPVESGTGDGIQGTTNAADRSMILGWDSDSQRYIGISVDPADDGSDEAAGDRSEPTPALLPGQGFWLQNTSDDDHDVYLWGQVVLDSSIAMELVPGFNLIAYPYTAARTVDGAAAADEGTLESILGTLPTNRLFRFAGNKYWSATTPERGSAPVWQSATDTGEVVRLDIASGYFYRRTERGTATWKEQRPYEDLFPTDSRMGILSLATDWSGDMTLTIKPSGDAGESLDIFYQDLTPDGGFSATSGWDFAALGIPVNGAETVVWTDSGSHTRPRPSSTFGRCYMVSRADVDADDNGTADGREMFLLGAPDGGSGIPGSGDGDSGGIGDTDTTGPVRLEGSNRVVRADSALPGRTVYVSKCRGRDAFSGRQRRAMLFDGPKKTVRGGMQAVCPGDTLIIEEGNYREDLNISGRAVSVRIRGSVNLSGK